MMEPAENFQDVAIPKELRFDAPGVAFLQKSGNVKRRANHTPGMFKE